MAPAIYYLSYSGLDAIFFSLVCNESLIKGVKIPLSRVIVLSLFALNFKTMGTWWARPTSFTLAFCVSCFIFFLSHSWILSISHQSPLHHAVLHYLLYFYPLFLLSVLVNPWLTIPGSLSQDLLIPVFPIHNYSKSVTVIFSIVTGNDVIRESYLLDIQPH